MKKTVTMIALSLFALTTWAQQGIEPLALKAVNLTHILNEGSKEVIADVFKPEVGKKYTFIEFFATTCSICRANRPNLIATEKKHNSNTTFKLVGIDRQESVLRSFFETIKTEVSFPYVLDHKRLAAKVFKVVSTPTTIILDSQGRLLYRHSGLFTDVDYKKFENILK
jgi:thioredoxin-related protein